jgi:hypothetical protein
VWHYGLRNGGLEMRVGYSKSSEPAAGAGMALFTAALGLYGGVLWCGELQGFIIHEMILV